MTRSEDIEPRRDQTEPVLTSNGFRSIERRYQPKFRSLLDDGNTAASAWDVLHGAFWCNPIRCSSLPDKSDPQARKETPLRTRVVSERTIVVIACDFKWLRA